MTAPTTHDPRLREALKTLAKFEADRLQLLAERERDRQRIQSLEYHLASIRSANRRRRRAQAAAGPDAPPPEAAP